MQAAGAPVTLDCDLTPLDYAVLRAIVDGPALDDEALADAPSVIWLRLLGLVEMDRLAATPEGRALINPEAR